MPLALLSQRKPGLHRMLPWGHCYYMGIERFDVLQGHDVGLRPKPLSPTHLPAPKKQGGGGGLVASGIGCYPGVPNRRQHSLHVFHGPIAQQQLGHARGLPHGTRELDDAGLVV